MYLINSIDVIIKSLITNKLHLINIYHSRQIIRYCSGLIWSYKASLSYKMSKSVRRTQNFEIVHFSGPELDYRTSYFVDLLLVHFILFRLQKFSDLFVTQTFSMSKIVYFDMGDRVWTPLSEYVIIFLPWYGFNEIG